MSSLLSWLSRWCCCQHSDSCDSASVIVDVQDEMKVAAQNEFELRQRHRAREAETRRRHREMGLHSFVAEEATVWFATKQEQEKSMLRKIGQKAKDAVNDVNSIVFNTITSR